MAPDADVAPAAPVRLGLESTLRAARDAGRKLLVPYVTGGVRDDWTELVRAMADAGADAVEIGIPFSDPVMDGPTIQATSEQAIAGGATPSSILAELRGIDAGVPLVVMTYYNLVYHPGDERFAAGLAAAGVSGAIVPDVPLEEIGPWAAAADASGIETVLLAAPTASDERLARVCARSRGFVYGVSLLGVTGERATLAGTADAIARRLKVATDLPVVVGIGISTPEQARQVTTVADGVVIGSALMRTLLDGAAPEAVGEQVAAFRTALDRG
ncbi:MAG: tryptophan synthase subunit alpha [Acidimicrobiales bacterium]